MQFRSGQDKLVRVALSVGGRGSVDGGGKKLNMYQCMEDGVVKTKKHTELN
jgi:hypothetical protein